MAVLFSKSGFTPEEKEKKKGRDLILNLKTVTLFYSLSCNLMLGFAIHLYTESSKVALYLFVSLNVTDINRMPLKWI